MGPAIGALFAFCKIIIASAKEDSFYLKTNTELLTSVELRKKSIFLLMDVPKIPLQSNFFH